MWRQSAGACFIVFESAVNLLGLGYGRLGFVPGRRDDNDEREAVSSIDHPLFPVIRLDKMDTWLR